jgi:hypothetical protein
VTASLAWPNTPSARSSERSQYQVAAPAKSRTPNLHRAIKRSHQSADGRVATKATARQASNRVQTGKEMNLSSTTKKRVDNDRPSHGRANAPSSLGSGSRRHEPLDLGLPTRLLCTFGTVPIGGEIIPLQRWDFPPEPCPKREYREAWDNGQDRRDAPRKCKSNAGEFHPGLTVLLIPFRRSLCAMNSLAFCSLIESE